MFKKISTILFCFFLCANSLAQANSYKVEEKVITQEIEVRTVLQDEEEETNTKKYENFGKDVTGDTLINFNNFELETDSLYAWKNAKKYAWIKTIENDLKQNLEKETKDAENNMEKGRHISKGVSATDSFFNSSILKIILWTLAAFFVGFVVYNLFLSNGIFGKQSKQSSATILEDAVDENDMESDFATLQKKAYDAGDTRLAMRYLFLKMLQKLDQKKLIQFAADKTNAVYASELTDGFRNDFSALASYFEYVWYGKFAIGKDVFDKIETQYNQFLNRV